MKRPGFFYVPAEPENNTRVVLSTGKEKEIDDFPAESFTFVLQQIKYSDF
jgi:hypothetical protein